MKGIFFITFNIICLQVAAQQYDKIIPKIISHKILPVAGYNEYDGFQLGGIIHNLEILHKKLTYYAAPAFGFNSKNITGYAGVNYKFQQFTAGLNAATFSVRTGNDTLDEKVFEKVYKVAPYLRYSFTAAENMAKWVEFKTFIIGERNFDYVLNHADSFYYPAKGQTETRYLNQLTFNIESFRELFPYDAQLQLQQAKEFYRINLNANYFFNYLNEGGVQVRLFAAKFGYLGSKTFGKQLATNRFQPKLTAVRGNEDYTYSNYFLGRNEFDGFASQQIMMRDGGLKLRTDMFQDLQGRSDDWVASINLNTSLPSKIFPPKIPLKIFLDAGTYAVLWKKESVEPRFLYVAGLQLSLIRGLVNVYAPIIYSKKFRDNLSTLDEENKFFKKISFSIDIQRFNLRRFTDSKPIP